MIGGDVRSWQNNAGVNNGRVFGWTYAGVTRLPKRISYAIGWIGTAIAHRRMRDVTRAIAGNLRAVRPEASEQELVRLARSTYRSYARDVIDFISSLSMTSDELDDLFEIPDRGAFDAARALGRGLILVTGHFGNWEIGGVLMRHLGFPLHVVAMTEPDPAVNDLRRRIRESLGIQTIEVRQSLDTALQIRRCLGENAMVAMLMDRHVGRDRVRVRFLGREAWFLQAPAAMGYLSGAPLVPCFLERQDDGRFLVQAGTPIVMDRTLARNDAVQRTAQAFAAVLEDRIRARPDLWYQFYDYWAAQGTVAADADNPG